MGKLERDVQGKMIKSLRAGKRQMEGKEAQWRENGKQRGRCWRENEMEERGEKAESEWEERCLCAERGRLREAGEPYGITRCEVTGRTWRLFRG